MARTPDFLQREDKLKDYLEGISRDFLFDELSAEYLEEKHLEFLNGVSLPFKASDLVEFKTNGLDITRIADNMALTVGSNTHFPYVGAYIKFFAKFFDEKLVDVFTTKASEALIKEQFRTSAAYYRAALCLSSNDQKAMFGYACCCREWYLSLEGEDDVDELVTILKADAMEYYEWSCEEYPDFAAAYYYLGYCYLNLALYAKASFVWRRYLQLSDSESDEYKEIKERIDSLEDPVKIEGGINKLLAGKYEEGLRILEPYVESSYSNWWPLHYYLASAYNQLGFIEEAIEGFKRVLTLAPSNEDSILALAQIYRELGDTENTQKYEKKYDLVRRNSQD